MLYRHTPQGAVYICIRLKVLCCWVHAPAVMHVSCAVAAAAAACGSAAAAAAAAAATAAAAPAAPAAQREREMALELDP